MINVNKIRSNPYRDYELNPLDQAAVERLKQSIDDHGFWGGMICRALDDGHYELAMGHHRIEAVRQLGFTEIDIEYRDIDDSEIVLMMVIENATQRGQTTAAIIDAVAAAVRYLTCELLRNSGLGKFPQPKLFDTQDAFNSCRGKLKTTGLGHRVITKYCKVLKEDEVKDALATLKDSGKYAEIFAECLTTVFGDDIPDEWQTAKSNAESRPRIYDEKCAQVFRNANQERAFREVVTESRQQALIPVEKQFEVAQTIRAHVDKTESKRAHDVGAPTVKRLSQDAVFEFVQNSDDHSYKVKQENTSEYAERKLLERYDMISRASTNILSQCAHIREHLAKYPELVTDPSISVLSAQQAMMGKAEQFLTIFQQLAGATASHNEAPQALSSLTVNRGTLQ